MLLKNANALLHDFMFQNCDISLLNGKIVGIFPASTAEPDEETIDCTGKLVLPGLVDVHTHGCDGVDVMDATYDAVNKISIFMAKSGVTSFLPTTMTMRYADIEKAFVAVGQAYCSGVDGASILGINMEGPYINPKNAGAQDPNCATVSEIEQFNALNEKSGNIVRLVIVAPEIPGTMEFIRQVSELGIHVSCGHTVANYDTMISAMLNGADHITHLYNAMTPLNHREPNVVGAALTQDGLMCELVCDGIHVHEAAVKIAYKMKGSDKLLFISDSMMATGLQDGDYAIGGQVVTVTDSIARVLNGNLAGSTAKLLDCVKKAVEFGISLSEAIKMASFTPAKSIGFEDSKGSIKVGKDADIIIVDENIVLKKTIIAAKVVFQE